MILVVSVEQQTCFVVHCSNNKSVVLQGCWVGNILHSESQNSLLASGGSHRWRAGDNIARQNCSNNTGSSRTGHSHPGNSAPCRPHSCTSSLCLKPGRVINTQPQRNNSSIYTSFERLSKSIKTTNVNLYAFNPLTATFHRLQMPNWRVFKIEAIVRRLISSSYCLIQS